MNRIILILIFIIFFGLATAAEETTPGFNEATFAGLAWRGIGPALMSGRISDLEIDPRDRSTWYVGVGSGGVWKTTNRGNTWTPLFDEQNSFSIGDIALDPSSPNTIWVGTGENVGGRHVAFGDGVYRSRDGGAHWENLGLGGTEHIGMIVVDPRDPDTVYVAAQGPLWSGGGERGLFKTVDGGQSWANILSGNQYTGVTEVHLDPRDPDIVYAATHQRLRTVAALVNGGPGSAIHKSTDGGTTWRKIVSGLPEQNLGKIGMAISPVAPDTLYASVELDQRNVAFFRSSNGGEHWEQRSTYESSSTGPHYYVELWASPHDVDVVYEADNSLRRTTDGGADLQQLRHPTKHVDHHALAFDPDVPGYLLVGTDGGLYESWDEGATWRFIDNLPVTQFYKVAVDNDTPFYNLYGGTQDNATQGGPSRTDNVHGIRNEDWFITVFADGHQPAVDWSNPDIVYSEWQEGNLVRYDRRNGEIVYIQPQPEADEPGERFNWDAPILVSTHDPARLYFASQRVWRSDDRGDSWTPVSGDLTHAKDRLLEPMMGQVWAWDSAWDLAAMSKFGTISAIAESPLDENLLYAGTDDGRIHVSGDGGDTWRAVDALPGVPDGFFVNDIKADLHDVDTVYVLVDNHKSGDFSPYVFKSTNRGKLWRNIAGNLPDRHLAWRLVQDHEKAELLFIGTEFGVYFTLSGGENWTPLSGGVPTIAFRDLAIQKRENDLVGATFGRGFFILDDYSALRQVTLDQLQAEATLFPPRDAPWYVPRRPLGDWRTFSKAEQGDSYFVAPNPPFGAVFTYYLADGYSTAQEQRKKSDRSLNAAGNDAPYPGFERLREERGEDAPAVLFTVRDSAGDPVRRIEGSTEPGFHRVAWDLRYAESSPWVPEDTEGWLEFPGPLAAPGQYSVTMSKRINGVETDLSEPVRFDVVPIRNATLTGMSPDAMSAFVIKLDNVAREAGAAGAAITAALTETGAIKSALLRSTASPELHTRADEIEGRLEALQVRLSGDPARERMNAPGAVSINARLYVAQVGTAFSAYGATPTHERSLEIGLSALLELQEELRKVLEQQLPALRAELDAAGVPWTPGRGSTAAR